MQKQTRGIEKNGIIGQERDENLEKNGYREQNGGRETSVMAKLSGPRGWGWEQEVYTEVLSWCLYKSPARTEATCLEGEIISSRISKVSRKNLENYSPLISFHFIIVCLS